MAGIGFELKKLFREKSAMGYLKAYTYTSVVTTGPFVLMTGMVVSVQILFNFFEVSYIASQLYTASVIYPFVFSHIISSGFSMLITRYVADLLYDKQHEDVVPSLYGMLVIALGVGSLFALIFFINKPLDFFTKLVTYIFYMEMIVIWIQGVYLSALKDFKGIIRAYAAGVIIAVILVFGVLTMQLPTVLGTLVAMDIGGMIIAAMLMMNIQKFFAKSSNHHFLFLSYFEEHWRLFFTSLFYTLGLYIPNIIIWQGPLQMVIADTYVYSPIYDVATFYAFLSILPIMIMFVVSTEIYFYQKYAAYFMYITEKGNFKEIQNAREDLVNVLWSEVRNIIEFQLVFTLIFLALGNYFLTRFGLAHNAINMYNLIVLGAFSIGILQVVNTLLLYFEDQRGAMAICASFLLLNTIFNVIGLMLGEETYGFTFFLAAFISLLISMLRLDYFVKRLDYYIFCSRPVFYQKKQWVFTRIVNWLYRKEKQDIAK